MEIHEEFHKTIPVIRDTKLNPSCKHGPTILFERNSSRFFACSAFRSRKLCPFFLQEDQWKSPETCQNKEIKRKFSDQKFPESESENTKRLKTQETPSLIDANSSLELKNKANQLIKEKELPKATQRDKGEAQYHFSEDTVQFLIQQFKNNEIDSVLCIGTPSLHEYIRERKEILKLKSFLLDIDERLVERYTENEFALYNMCNHFFFNGENKHYRNFLKRSSSVAIVTDPPFGVKVELVWNGGLKGAIKDFTAFPDHENEVPSLFWIFPYFNEGHILNKCPDSGLQMSDYKVEYKNHTKFSGKKSPVRIFTNVSLSAMNLSEEFYRFCNLCSKWVDKNNMHCKLCGVCPTKDGGKTYKHCKMCRKCVKPTWIHCKSCKKCHLETLDCNSKLETTFHKNSKVRNTKKLKSDHKIKRTVNIHSKVSQKKQKKGKKFNKAK